MEHATLLLILATLSGFFMAWGIGANDVANAMGTSVGSRALTYLKATCVAAVFEASGAILAGGQVTDTIRSQVVDPQLLIQTPELLVYGMLASLLAAGVWLLIATRYGLPVSATHTIIGALVGFGAINLGVNSIKWSVISNIVLSWIVTPIIAGFIAHYIFLSIKKLILITPAPLDNAKYYAPAYTFFVIFIITLITITKGLIHIDFRISTVEAIVYSLSIAAIASASTFLLLRWYHPSQGTQMYQVEKIFSLLQILTACCMAFAHGSNDIANAIGPLAAIVSVLNSGKIILNQTGMPLWILLLGACDIVTGLATYGFKVIATVGSHITELTPTRGFSAEIATASTVIIASGLGLPISTTQTLVGAIIGVAFARGISALNIKIVRSIFFSWVTTLPAGAVLAIVFFYFIKTALAFI